MPQRKLELGAKHRERRPELVAGVGDEVALAVDRGLEPVEHLVQRLAEPFELVPGRRNGKPLTGGVGGDGRRPPAHRLHLLQRQTGEEVAREGSEDQRNRSRDQQLVTEAGEGLCPVLASRTDDQDEPPAATPDGGREKAGGLVEAGHRRSVGVDRSTAHGGQLLGGQDRRAAERLCRVEHATARGHELRVALAALDEAAAALALERRVLLADQRREVLRAELQLAVERELEV